MLRSCYSVCGLQILYSLTLIETPPPPRPPGNPPPISRIGETGLPEIPHPEGPGWGRPSGSRRCHFVRRNRPASKSFSGASAIFPEKPALRVGVAVASIIGATAAFSARTRSFEQGPQNGRHGERDK